MAAKPVQLDYEHLEHLAKTVKGVRRFAKEAKLTRSTLYRLKKTDQRFKEIVDKVEHRQLGDGAGKKPWVPNIYHIQELAAAGLNKPQIAGVLGVAYTTYNEYEQITPEMVEAFEVGQSEGVGKVKSVLFELATVDRNLDAVKTYLRRHDHETEERPDRVVIDVQYNQDYYKNKKGAT